ncbi:MAG: hypothetical protein US49_C0002G0051 [candidate division TM6 bacterium GW2011_GWF2_37_49]|nr:MAG: hypothetical protein US49_C0002G0051 [candidate division TM6 bacterium GW2011_GWF2_37_49]
MKKLLTLTALLLTVFPMILNCMEQEAASTSDQAARAGIKPNPALEADLSIYYDSATETLNLAARKLTYDIFKAELRRISIFIKANKVVHLNLENNLFDYVPLELIQLMISSPSLATASLKGNFNRDKGLNEITGVLLPEILKCLQQLAINLATQNPKELEAGNLTKKTIFLDENMPPLEFVVTPQMQQAAPSKLKPLLLSGLTFIAGIVATQGVNLLSMYLKGWLSQNSDCSCP